MATDNLMCAVDSALQVVKGNSKPFGGLSIIVVLDPLPLPPVVDHGKNGTAVVTSHGGSAAWRSSLKDFDK